ncbi:MAG: uroporphyrinogen-III synthase [Bdellovibrionales bacterium]
MTAAPAVLITRPAAMAGTLASRLHALGYETVIEPLLSIVPTCAPRPAGKVDAVMITSGNVFSVLEEHSVPDGLLDLPCYCVGPRTATKARAFGFRDVRNSAGDGAELARFIDASFENRKAAILHIAGSHTETKVRLELEGRDHGMAVWPVYHALAADELSPALRILLENRCLAAVLVFSPRTAGILHSLLVSHGLEACCADLAAICLSSAAADPLRPLGWRFLAAAEKPAEDAAIACLQKLCPVKS